MSRRRDRKPPPARRHAERGVPRAPGHRHAIVPPAPDGPGADVLDQITPVHVVCDVPPRTLLDRLAAEVAKLSPAELAELLRRAGLLREDS